MPVCQLHLRNLQYSTRIGWPDREREAPQPIEINVILRFQEPPPACQSDELNQSVCYDQIASQIRQFLSQNTFRLLETLGAKLHQELRKHLSHGAEIWLEVRKVHPPIPEMHGGVSFSIGDWSP